VNLVVDERQTDPLEAEEKRMRTKDNFESFLIATIFAGVLFTFLAVLKSNKPDCSQYEVNVLTTEDQYYVGTVPEGWEPIGAVKDVGLLGKRCVR
jgi:hypothetical protein